jgi:ubiquinone/menaquinone biosynthesis C-methylase UbiE
MINSKSIKRKILNDYYENVYQKYLFGKGIQAKGINYFEKSLENFWNENLAPQSILELGAGNGEHVKYVKLFPTKNYHLVDLRFPQYQEHLNNLTFEQKKTIKFINANAEKLPLKPNFYDKVFSTCLLHHVNDPMAVMLEARRVTKKNGEIAFILPTDPGILNQLVKKIISYRKIKKISSVSPELIYALEHRNHISSLIAQAKYVYLNDDLKIYFRPFFIKSWNLNLWVVIKINKIENT